MNVCFVSHSANRGGAELSLLELIDALRRRGVACSCLLPEDGELRELLAEREVDVTIVKYPLWVGYSRSLPHRLGRTFKSARSVRQVARAIRHSGCDLVYTNTVAVATGAFAARIVGCPHVWHLREFGRDDHGLKFDWGFRLSRRLIHALSAGCVANSNAVAETYRLPAAAPEVIYNAVEIPTSGRQQPFVAPWRNPSAIHCVMVGTVQRRKGQEDAIRAVAKLRASGVPAELAMVGKCHVGYRERLDRLVDSLNLGDRIHLTGFSRSPLDLVQTADVLLMCSFREAFGRSTVEGMKLGKPVVGTRAGGTAEIVTEGVTGYLYSPGDVNELAAQIGRLYHDRTGREAMGRAACQSATRRFNAERYGFEVESLLRRIVDNHVSVSRCSRMRKMTRRAAA